MSKTFSIGELENFSEIKTHTIRMWEKRFGLFFSTRNNNKNRLYSNTQVAHLLNLKLLLAEGNKISFLSRLSHEEVLQWARLVNTEELKIEASLHRLIVLFLETNIEAFEEELDRAVAEWGIDKTVSLIIFRFLHRVRLLSYDNETAHQRFAISAIRKKIFRAIEGVVVKHTMPLPTLLFMPKGEHYDLFLLYFAYVLKLNGHRVLYLGTNTPEFVLQATVNEKKPMLIMSYSPQWKKFRSGISAFLESNHPSTRLLVSHAGAETDSVTDCFFHYKNIHQVVENISDSG